MTVDDSIPNENDSFWTLMRPAFLNGFVGTLLGLVVAIIYVTTVQPYYIAKMIIAPAEDEGTSALVGTVSGQVGASSLLRGGLFGGAQIGPQMEQYLQLMVTPTVIAVADRKGGLSRRIFADDIDPATGQWKSQRDGLKAAVQRLVFGWVGRSYREQPNIDMLSKVLGEGLDIQIIKKGPLQAISFKSTDRDLALSVLLQLHLATDGILRDRARASTIAQVRQLDQRRAAAQVAEVRASLAELLAQQHKRLAIVESDLPYAVTVLQAPTTGADPDGPRVFGSLILGGLGGGVLGLLVYIWLWRRSLRALFA